MTLLAGLVGCGDDSRPPRTDTGPVDAGTDASDAGATDVGADAGRCVDVACSGDTPVCNPADGACVQCVATTDCAEGDCVENACVVSTCETNDECSSATASLCGASGRCEPCMLDEDCTHLGETLACVEGECGTRAPDSTCEPCTADSDCGTGVCIRMRFEGVLLTGSWCAQRAPAGVGVCPARPYRSRIRGRTNVDSTVIDDFCSVDESRTTCDAVRHAIARRPCEDASTCGVAGTEDAFCVETVCTYPCATSDACQPGDTCEPSAGGVLYCQ